MEQHGVHLDESDEQRLGAMDEADMIDELVSRMPSQSKEQFQHFFLQLQLIVSTATRVRQALEEGRSDEVQEALDDAEATGISQYIMKMAIIQAGSEVLSLQQQHKSFVKDSESKLGKMVRGQEDSLQAKRRLATAQNQLNMMFCASSTGAYQVVEHLNANNDSVFVKVIFNAWVAFQRHAKMEREVFETYRERIEKAARNLSDAQANHLANSHNFLSRKIASFNNALLSNCLGAFKAELDAAKAERARQYEISIIQQRLQKYADQAAENAKKVMARMTSGNDAALIAMCMQGWITDFQSGKNEKKQMAEEEASKKQAEDFVKNQSGNAKSIMGTMAGASDSGMVYQFYNAWKGVAADAKKASELQKVVEGGKSKLAAFSCRNKGPAMSAMEKAMYQQELLALLQVFGAWRMDTRMERITKQNQTHIEAKKGQLSKVHTMFQQFAP